VNLFAKIENQIADASVKEDATAKILEPHDRD
jgi:hypothetical protein